MLYRAHIAMNGIRTHNVMSKLYSNTYRILQLYEEDKYIYLDNKICLHYVYVSYTKCKAECDNEQPLRYTNQTDPSILSNKTGT
jgi:hypothetical protein